MINISLLALTLLAAPPPLIDTPEKAVAAQTAYAAEIGRPPTWTNSIGMTFALVPPGSFIMGGADEDAPPRRVTITKGFYIAATETTRKHWEQVTGKKHSDYYPGENKPINCARYYDLLAFTGALNKLESRDNDQPQYRAPTEAEWEYAARAGQTADTVNDDDAWTIRNSDNQLHDVATRAANALGVHDMQGNVWEWCSDIYDPQYYTYGDTTDPAGATLSTYGYHTLRGGSALHGPNAARFGNRAFYQGSRTDQHIGFRVVLPIE